MALTFTELSALFPHQLWLEVSEQTQAETWHSLAQQRYSNPAARWTAYLNTLCLNQFLAWWQANFDDEFQLSFDASIWEMINGTLVTVGETRIVLIPQDQTNCSEVCIPQEWIDIPTWIPDYYLAVQLNLAECWLRMWGYATRAQILDRANYDSITQTYALPVNDLIANLDVMWVAQELCPPAKPEVQALPSLLPHEIERSLVQLSHPTAYSPRLALPFSEWAAILASDQYRQQLYQLRLKQCEHPVVESSPVGMTHHLSQWLQKIFTIGWQSFDSLLAVEEKDLAFNLRSQSQFSEEIEIKGFKVVDLGLQLGEQTVVLIIGLTQGTDEKLCIRARLCPIKREAYLPANLDMRLLSESGTVLQAVRSRAHDLYIQLKRFKPVQGTRFSIQIALGEVSIKENFVFELE